MPWMYAFVGLLVGCVVGVVLSRITTPQYKQKKSLQNELDGAKAALEQQRQELTEHFSQTAGMLDTIGKDYTKLYQHLAKTSSKLIPNIPEQDNPFVKAIGKNNETTTETEVNERTVTEDQPKDYAKGSSGGLKPVVDSSKPDDQQKS